MPDHTEREREARMAVAGGHSLTCSRSLFATTLCNCGGPTRPIARLDAYRAAVRAAFAEEVREMVKRKISTTASQSSFVVVSPDFDKHSAALKAQGGIDACRDIYAALTALEATDATGA